MFPDNLKDHSFTLWVRGQNSLQLRGAEMRLSTFNDNIFSLTVPYL
jgi:hypothetical protein